MVKRILFLFIPNIKRQMYCSGCGNSLNEKDNFCPNCGQKNIVKNVDKPSHDFKTLEFSSNFLIGGDILTPDKIIITNTQVTYRKRNRYLIGKDESTIPFNKISSVEIDRRLINSTILIYSTGNQKIVAKGFSIVTAKAIKRELEKRMNR